MMQVQVRDFFGNLEEFTLLSTLGSGAKSVVYRARCHSNSREVSLKLEPASKCSQLLNEADMLTILDGTPGVPTLLSCGMTLDNSNFFSTTDVVGI